MNNFLRWLAVLPGALLGGVLATFPLHWLLYATLKNFIEPYPPQPERVIAPLVIGGCFTWIGARIAPSRKFETAAVLLSLWMVLLGGTIAFTLLGGSVQGRGLKLEGGGVASAMAFIGGVGGFLVVWRQTGRDKPRK